jgi:hypothetical protein
MMESFSRGLQLLRVVGLGKNKRTSASNFKDGLSDRALRCDLFEPLLAYRTCLDADRNFHPFSIEAGHFRLFTKETANKPHTVQWPGKSYQAWYDGMTGLVTRLNILQK